MALTFPSQNELGTQIPGFSLKSVFGEKYSLSDFQGKQALVVMFICNHCPYVKAVEDRLIQLANDLKEQDVPVIGICSNDPHSNSEDSLESLKRRATEKNYSFLYLHDPEQTAAHSFGAVCTPDFFVYDSEGLLRYRGRLDDSWRDSSKVKVRELFEAVQLLLKNQAPPINQVPSMGCSLKWKKS